ncbi:transposable element Tcb2 transposase [Trichonephila clavipes]|nr:transposable element Tcb2 transposase [Trichonephila clavipes]
MIPCQTLSDVTLLAFMMIGYGTPSDDSADLMSLMVDILKATVRFIPLRPFVMLKVACRYVTRSTIRADVGVAIVPQTISRHLAEANLKSKRPFHALPLTPEHRQLRLQWCQATSMWNVTYWQKVVFSDESRFVLGTDDNRVRVWKRPVRPFLNGLPGVIFQQDNARPHTARVAQDFLSHFQTLPWPACSLDLSPVEHVWDQLKRKMPSCHSVHDLELAVQDLWANLPQDNIRCLINSMPDRVAACIAAGGSPTRY